MWTLRNMHPEGITLAVLALFAACAATAGGTVTVCGSDDAAGGVNLAQALATGGHVDFSCSGQITLTRTYVLNADYTIDGGNKVVLRAAPGGMFIGGARAARVTLRNIKMRGASAVHSGALFDGPATALELAHVNVEDAAQPDGRYHGRASDFLLRAAEIGADHSNFFRNQGIVLWTPKLRLNDCKFANNTGAPFRSLNTGTAYVGKSTFVRNGSGHWNGDIEVNDSTFLTNGDMTTFGGALSLRGKVGIANSEFAYNVGGNGGAIWLHDGSLNITGSQFHDNIASHRGGAIAVARATSAARITLRHVTFKLNSASLGGAIHLENEGPRSPGIDGHAVSFFANRAHDKGGGINAFDAGIRLARAFFVDNEAGNFGAAVTVRQTHGRRFECANCVIARNRAPAGGAFWGNGATFVSSTILGNGNDQIAAPKTALLPVFDLHPPDVSAPISFRNTLLMGNLSGACAEETSYGPYLDLGNNLQFPFGDCGATIPTDFAWLGAHLVPYPWSPALLAGDATVCASPPVDGKDVYGVRRPLATRCTIGAVEGNVSHLVERLRRRRD
jgi:hypothetical protein